MPRSNVILFMAHYLSDSILERFEAVKKASSEHTHVKCLYDNSKKTFDAARFHSDAEYFLYDIEDLAHRYPLMNAPARSLVPGNCIFPMLFFADEGGAPKAEFDYFWRIEYDAGFNGDWNLFFDSFAENDSDLLGTTLFGYDFRPDWNWWQSLKTPSGSIEQKRLLRGYFPVLRLSRKAIGILQAAYKAGWQGHEEVAIPTILNFYGCSLEDIGGDGEFVKSENKNRFYTNTPAAAGLAPGTFVYRPNRDAQADIPNMLYHPVKD